MKNLEEIRFLSVQAVFLTTLGGPLRLVEHEFTTIWQVEIMTYEIKRGLNIPISGEPVQQISDAPAPSQVALLGDDYVGMRPSMLVKEGDKVKMGQPVFSDKKTEGVIFTAPAAGTVQSVNRGEKRKFLSMVIDVDGNAEETFQSFNDLGSVDGESARELLTKSGLWTSFRTRPYNRVPAPATEPNSIFVTAMDTNPLSGDPELIIAQYKDHFVAGLNVISKLTDGKTYVCTRSDSRVPGKDIDNVNFEVFDGPHPAGLPGTHIHLLDPVTPNKTVWFIGYADVIAIGHLFTTGKLLAERIVSIAGPRVTKPGLFRTRLGARIGQVVEGNVEKLDDSRCVSGSVLSGRTASEPLDFLGRYHNQITVLEEGNKREFMGWQGPGAEKFSVTNIYLGALLNRFRGKKFAFNTNINGSHRGMVPVETYENVMPLDILPTHLLRALISGDTELAQDLGCLELDEDDLALCTYVCPGKYDYGQILRENLTRIEKEG